MNLIKTQWQMSDKKDFLEYLHSFSKPDKIEWTRKIINTKLDLLAIPTPTLTTIIKEISKGNFLSFLELKINDYYDSISINGFLIMKINDFELMKSYLIPYAEAAENWATCDLLRFNVTEKNKFDWWGLAVTLITNPKPFARRIGLDIFFKFINDDNYIDSIFNIISGLVDEPEYYVNMVISWLLAECFIKQRDKTLEFLKTTTLNKFVANKTVSKCRDSFRISKEDKEMLLQFKK